MFSLLLTTCFAPPSRSYVTFSVPPRPAEKTFQSDPQLLTPTVHGKIKYLDKDRLHLPPLYTHSSNKAASRKENYVKSNKVF
jgi:hypothetical protein